VSAPQPGRESPRATNVAHTKSRYPPKSQMKSKKTWHYIFAIPAHPIQ
jgi:hypothetical protein